MTIGRMTKRLAGAGILAVLLAASPVWAQKAQKGTAPLTGPATGPLTGPMTAPQYVSVEQPNSEEVRGQFNQLLDRYPPTLRRVFKEDPTLMTQEQYLAAYPALANFLTGHPEIPLNPTFYLDGLSNERVMDRSSRVFDMWNDLMKALAIFCGFGIAIGLLTWLIRTFLDYRRWNRLSKVQTEVHTRLLDRFSTNEELMAYIATPAGSKFLQSAPISLDMGTSSKSMGAPLNRIMWSIQAGLVMLAAGIGLMVASGRVGEDATLPLQVMGILAMALGVGFAVSAGVSYLLSQKLGLLEQLPKKRSADSFEA